MKQEQTAVCHRVFKLTREVQKAAQAQRQACGEVTKALPRPQRTEIDLGVGQVSWAIQNQSQSCCEFAQAH